jgi:putative transposase
LLRACGWLKWIWTASSSKLVTRAWCVPKRCIWRWVLAGEKGLLGQWIAQTEGANFWLQVVTELKNRGVAYIFVACVDGLKGFRWAIEAEYPQTAVQLFLVYMVRNSLNYASWKMRQMVAADLKTLYSAATADEAVLRLKEFEEKWGEGFPTIVK